MRDDRMTRRLAALMAADVTGFSRLVEANEEGTLASLRNHRSSFIDPLVGQHGGRIFKDLGDGFLAEFSSAHEAMSCAIAIQRGMPDRNRGIPEDRHIRFALGLHLGDVMVRADDLFGDDVNIAARIMGLAQPGGIACSGLIRQLIGSRIGADFADQGEKALRNISNPVQVFLVDPAPLEAAPERPQAAAPSRAPERPQSGKPSIAVLPFANMSGDPEQEYFSDGITEDIITDLSNVSELFVLSRNAVFMYKGKPADMEKMSKELGVAYLVHGSVRKSGAKVRITAQLTEGASGGHLWAERYDRSLTDIFALQEEISKTIIDQLKVKLLPRELRAIEQAPTTNVEAYNYYLRGRELFHRGSQAGYHLAKRMFAKAIELDPGYARAYAGLADIDAFLYMDYSEDVVADVLKNSEKALALAGTLIEARASRALALSTVHRYAEAEREFESVIAQDPNHFEARYFYGRSCYAQGKFADTAVHWERAAEVKPDDYQALILLNQVYNSLDRNEDALRASRRGIERAEREFARNPENPRPAYFIATAAAKLGDMAKAGEWAERALALAPDDFLTLYNLMCFYSVRREIGRAFELLDKLLPRAKADMLEWIVTDSDLEPMHHDPRWDSVRRAIPTSRP